MNNLNTKTNRSLIILIFVLILIVSLILYVNNSIKNYKDSIMSSYNKLAELNKEKNTLDIYRKVLLKDSDESKNVKKYILSKDRKEVLGLIDQIESYARNTNISAENSSPIVSVANRDNATVGKFNAKDFVIDIRVSGERRNIEDFLDLLNNLPLVSYIERLDLTISNSDKSTNANIKLIIYQKNEIK